MENVENSDIEEVEFQPGDLIFKENEKSFHFYIIQEGNVEIFKTTPSGKLVSLAIVTEGASVGEYAMIDKQPRSAAARAMTKVRAVRVSESAYELLIKELPDWAVSVMRALVDRLRHTNEVLRRVSLTDSKVREEIDSAKVELDGTTVRDESPFLSISDDDVEDFK